MKWILVIIFLVNGSLSCNSSETKKKDALSNIDWGISISQVKKMHKNINPRMKKDKYGYSDLIYEKVDINGFVFDVTYTFKNNELQYLKAWTDKKNGKMYFEYLKGIYGDPKRKTIQYAGTLYYWVLDKNLLEWGFPGSLLVQPVQ